MHETGHACLIRCRQSFNDGALASPVESERHIIASGASGAWTGRDHQIAVKSAGDWRFYPPDPGWVAYIKDEGRHLVWTGAAWSPLQADDALNRPSLNGAVADDQNRLALSSPASLFEHADDDHRLKINKAASSNTANIVFQTSCGGRAELGLIGQDDLEFKVSPDGAT